MRTRDLRLALRLLRGGGRRALLGTATTALGLAVAVLTVLLVVQVPSIVGRQDAVVRERTPVTLEGRSRSPVLAAVEDGSWHGRTLTRLFLTVSDPGAPLPPGLRRLPATGERIVSPALRTALAASRSAGLRRMVPGRTAGLIGEPGLAGPDELYAYVGVAPADLPPDAEPVDRFGLPPGARVYGSGRHRFLGAEIAVVVLPAVIVFLTVSARFSAATRRRRHAALALAGAEVRTVARVAALDSAVAGLLGAALGLLAHPALSRMLGRTGWVGIRWFPDQAGIGVLQGLAVLLALALSARLVGAHAGRRAIAGPLTDRRDPGRPGTSWWRAIPLVGGVGLLTPLLPFSTSGGVRQALALGCLVAGTALACAGLVLVAEPAVALAARGLRQLARGAGARLGAARASHDSTAARLSTALGLVVLVGALGTTLVRIATGTEQIASSATYVTVGASDLPAPALAAVADLVTRDGGRATVTSRTIPDTGGGSGQEPDRRWRLDHVGVDVLVDGCPGLRRALGAPLSTCRPGQWYRVAQPDPTLRPGDEVTFHTATGTTRVVVPAVAVRPGEGREPVPGSVELAYSGAAPPWGWTADALFSLVLPPGLSALDTFTQRLATAAPTASFTSSTDLQALAAFHSQRAALRFATGTGIGLGALAFVLAVADRARERRRTTAMLTALGAHRPTLVVAQVVEAAVPALVLGCVALGVGWLAANAFLGVDDPPRHWTWAPLSAFPLVAVGLAAALVSALVVAGTNPRSEDLRRE